jgi:uncharacterized membrane protein YcaP (DUF421 family)
MGAIFDGWSGIIRVLIAAPIMYISIIAFVRIMGKRSTSQMNNFDWVVTVALGSLVASGIILDNVTVIEALLATGLLLGLQWTLTYWVPRWTMLEHVVKAQPTLLAERGKLLESSMLAERVTHDEIYAALRGAGLANIDEAEWVILETDASISVIAKDRRDFAGVSLVGFEER